jgi:hypothetical protein
LGWREFAYPERPRLPTRLSGSSTGAARAGAALARRLLRRHLTAEQYEPLLRRQSTFLKQGDLSKVVAVGPSADDYHWTEALMDSRNQFDLLSLQHYTLPTGDWSHKGPATGFTKAQWIETLAQTRRMEELLTRHSAIHMPAALLNSAGRLA